MGQVVAFSLVAKRARREEAPPAGDAQILLFLGVRYVRMGDPPNLTNGAPSDNGGASSRGRKRKRGA
ncbi:MAG: hypothetical protein HYS06_05205 [Methylocystis sp.]|nr:hypothetical protein [Methylocystis sp.]MBI3274513.1 hypothetical protein [Methylocystis sp.]